MVPAPPYSRPPPAAEPEPRQVAGSARLGPLAAAGALRSSSARSALLLLPKLKLLDDVAARCSSRSPPTR